MTHPPSDDAPVTLRVLSGGIEDYHAPNTRDDDVPFVERFRAALDGPLAAFDNRVVTTRNRTVAERLAMIGALKEAVDAASTVLGEWQRRIVLDSEKGAPSTLGKWAARNVIEGPTSE
jgi:hypothetical protein